MRGDDRSDSVRPDDSEGHPDPRLPLGPRERITEGDVAPLALRYQRGDSHALAQLHDRLGPAILSALRPYRTAPLPSTVTYQDVAQQTWIVLAELATRWRPHGSFLAYFFNSFPRAIRRYVATAGARKHGLTEVISIPYDELVRAADAIGEATEESTQLLWTHQLDRLPVNQRRALLMRIVDGQDFQAIAQALELSRASAHRLYRRALARLGCDVEASSAGRAEQRAPSDSISAAEDRFIRVLHTLAGPDRAVMGRRRAADATHIGRRQFTLLIDELETAGAIADRSEGRAGHLVDATAEETLARLRAYRGC